MLVLHDYHIRQSLWSKLKHKSWFKSNSKTIFDGWVEDAGIENFSSFLSSNAIRCTGPACGFAKILIASGSSKMFRDIFWYNRSTDMSFCPQVLHVFWEASGVSNGVVLRFHTKPGNLDFLKTLFVCLSGKEGSPKAFDVQLSTQWTPLTPNWPKSK